MKFNNINIDWLGHASFKIKTNKIIYIDPFKINNNEPADIILITHSHYDHCSLEDIKKILKQETIILGPIDIQSKISKLSYDIKFQPISPGKNLKIEEIKVQSYPAYNIDKKFHPKNNEWLGYLIEIENLRIFHAGDSDVTPELQDLKNIHILILPVGGTYTMNAKEAASLTNIIKPKVAIPMHFGSIIGDKKDALEFKNLVKTQTIILDNSNV
jgi:L-ascorbate metabolism protein UlaG (beta-lactamase superfamily)